MLPPKIARRLRLGALLSLAVSLAGPSLAEIPAAEGLVGFDFTGVRAGSVVNRQVALPNADGKPIAIKRVNASCSWMRILGFTGTVPANGTGSVLVEFRPPKSGRFDEELLVETDREKNSVVALNWSGEIASAGDNPLSAPTGPRGGILVSPQDVALMRGSASAVLVDVREPGDFNLCHMDGSVNWPVRVLKGISSLKARKLVLIGKGSDDESLVREALALRDAGFESTHVLQGGLRAWAEMRLSLSGPRVGTVQPASVAPLEFFATRQDEWLVIDVGSSGGGPGVGIPGASRLALGSDWVSDLSKILGAEAVKRGGPFRVLIVSEGGEKYEVVEKALPANLPAPVFYLDGGLRAYRHFAQEYAALMNRREIRLTTNQGAAPGSNATATHDTTGCASCPKKNAAK